MNQRGFSLLELGVVMAMVAVLISIAVPRYAAFFLKSKEAAMKGNLATVRSAVTVYYSHNEGVFPASAAQLAGSLTGGGKYLKELPRSVTYPLAGHPATDAVTGAAGDDGRWLYIPAPVGHVAVNCTHGDTRNSPISTW